MSNPISLPGSLVPIQTVNATVNIAANSAESLIQALNVADGAVLRGVVNGRTSQGATVIQTEAGDVAIQTGVFLKRGVEVTIQIERKQNETFGRLVTIEGKSVPRYLDQAATSNPPANDTISTSPLGGATKASATASNAVTSPEQVIPARVEAVLLNKPLASAEPLPTPTTTATASGTSAAPASATPVTDVPELPPPPPLPAALQQALNQSVSGSRLVLDVLGVTFPNATSTAPAPANEAATTTPASTNLASTNLASGASAFAPSANASASPAGIAAYQRAALTNPASVAPALPAPVTSVPAQPALTPTLPTSPSLPVLASALPPTEVSVTPPIVSQTPAPITPPLNAPSLTTPTLTAPNLAADASPTAAPPVNAGTAAAPTSAPSATPAPLPAPTQAGLPLPATQPVFSATIIGDSGPQELILQTPIGTLKLLNTAPLPQGTQLQVRINTILPAPTESETDSTLLAATGALERGSLAAIDEYAAQSLQLPRLAGGGFVPSFDKNTLSDVLFLLAALKGGDLKRWIGDARHKDLERKEGDFLGRLLGDFTSLRAAGVESRDPQGWNSYLLPFQGLTEPVRFFHKGGREQNDTPEGDSEHFLVDAHFSRFGHVQLDGLIKKMKPLHFDLFIRSEQSFTPEMERDIRAIYQEASEISGYQGNIAFRFGPKACVSSPLETASEHSQENSIVV